MSPLAKDVVIGLASLAISAGFVGLVHKDVTLRQEASYQKGVEVGMAKAYKSAKDQIEADPNYTRVVCKLWWFGMDHRERSVK
jgi:hypothetical protein